jgi:hypothetical protein
MLVLHSFAFPKFWLRILVGELRYILWRYFALEFNSNFSMLVLLTLLLFTLASFVLDLAVRVIEGFLKVYLTL